MSRLRKRWKSTPVTIRAVIIGGLLGLVGVIIPLIPSITQATKRANYPLLELLSGELGVGWGSDIITDINGQKFAVVPTECLRTGDYIYDDTDIISTSVAFAAVSSQSLVIREIALVLDSVSPPPSAQLVSEIRVLSGVGTGGAVPENELPVTPLINNQFQREVVSGNTVYDMTANDVDAFRAFVYFDSPGIYTFHLEIEGRSFDREEFLLVTEPATFGWLKVDDLDQIAGGQFLEACDT